jgi:hypothetical protein
MYKVDNNYDFYGDHDAAFHYCKDPITTPTFKDKTRYKKNLVVWTCRKGEWVPLGRQARNQSYSAPYGYWVADYLLVGRIDYDPDVIDFDAELFRAKLF